MMTEVYLLRHAQPEQGNFEDKYRPLSQKGISDLPKVTAYFSKRPIDAVYASTYERAIRTIEPYCQAYGYQMHLIDDFREANLGHCDGDFKEFICNLWNHPEVNNGGGEPYAAVQKRTIEALKPLLDLHRDQSFIVAMHSTAMSLMVNYYNPEFVCEDYLHLICFAPCLVKLLFDGQDCKEISFYDFVSEEA